MKDAANEEMALSGTYTTKCYAVCMKEKKRRDAESNFVWNLKFIGSVAIYRKETKISVSGLLNQEQLAAFFKDKRQVECWFAFITGYSNSTAIEVISMPVENFNALAKVQI